ncbi:MAG: DUF2851 family protein [Saprospiraceae bacterium]
MGEGFLTYLWKRNIWLNLNIQTTDGSKIEVQYPGELNTNQGPDFSFAKLKIGEILWVGHVEIHYKSSDWIKHNHTTDSNYHNVILHVVWIHDQEIIINGVQLPTFELSKFNFNSEKLVYDNLLDNNDPIPCAKLLAKVPSLYVISQLEWASIERLENKTIQLKNLLDENNQDWEYTFYKYLCRYLVSPNNVEAMEILTNKISWKEINKQRTDLINLETLFLGTSGMLNIESQEDYVLDLQNRFLHLKNKLHIVPMNVKNWFYLRLRPNHFPSLRIAQIASFLHFIERPFQRILESNNLIDAWKLLDIEVSTYWKTHYQLGHSNNKSIHSHIGESTKNIIFINVVVPMLFMYGELTINPSIRSKALNWMEELKAENNKYTRIWEALGIKMLGARQSQGCLQQYLTWCTNKKCLDCKIGNFIINKA